jgi:hypothetical protein
MIKVTVTYSTPEFVPLAQNYGHSRSCGQLRIRAYLVVEFEIESFEPGNCQLDGPNMDVDGQPVKYVCSQQDCFPCHHCRQIAVKL